MKGVTLLKITLFLKSYVFKMEKNLPAMASHLHYIQIIVDAVTKDDDEVDHKPAFTKRVKNEKAT